MITWAIEAYPAAQEIVADLVAVLMASVDRARVLAAAAALPACRAVAAALVAVVAVVAAAVAEGNESWSAKTH